MTTCTITVVPALPDTVQGELLVVMDPTGLPPPFKKLQVTVTVHPPAEQLADQLALDVPPPVVTAPADTDVTLKVCVLGATTPALCRLTVILLNTFPRTGPKSSKMAITTMATKTRISAYSISPCPFSLDVGFKKWYSRHLGSSFLAY